MGRLDAALTRIVSWPATVFLTLFLATLISIRGRDQAIQRAWPLVWNFGPRPWSWSWTATWFWALVGIAGLFAWLKERKAKTEKAAERALRDAERSQREAAERRAQELHNQLSLQLEHTAVRLESLPPKDLLGAFDDMFLRSHYAMAETAALLSKRPDGQQAQKAIEWIRVALFAATSLAQKFEGSPAGVTFSANVMLYRPMASLSGKEKVAVNKRLRWNDGVQLEGVLDMMCALSIVVDPTAAHTTLSPDKKVPSFAMPVPVLKQTPEQGWLTLPGAPHAFCSGEMDVCPSADAILKKCDERFVKKHLSKQIRDHLSNEVPHINSFVSVPLARSSNTDLRIGVLNINSSRPNIFADPKVQELFYPLVRPLLWMLSEVIVPLDKKHRDLLIVSDGNSTASAP